MTEKVKEALTANDTLFEPLDLTVNGSGKQFMKKEIIM